MTGSLQETVLPIRCGADALTGILSVPTQASDIGVVVVVGGPQYRAGSHRQFVLLCRRLAEAGHHALRFDYRGMGDSAGALRNFEQVSDDIGAAIDAVLAAAPAVRRIVLWGLCDGASAALLYQLDKRDPRVAGLCLVNPWVRSDASLARTTLKHYYLDRLRQREFWLKLLSGRVAGKALRDLFASVRAARKPAVAAVPCAGSYQDRMALALRDFPGKVQILLSSKDYTAKEFMDTARSSAAWIAALQRARPMLREIEDADHTCSDAAAQRRLERYSLDWLGSALSGEQAHRA